MRGVEREEPDAIPIWPNMRDPFALFVDAQWGWLSLGLGGFVRTGIDRAGLEASARLLDVDLTPTMFADVRCMEQAAMEYWSTSKR